jgi:hypothetical protein
VIELLQRALRFERDESPQAKLGTLEGFLAPLPGVPSDVVPLLASLQRAQPELTRQLALGVPRLATKGVAAPEVERA